MSCTDEDHRGQARSDALAFSGAAIGVLVIAGLLGFAFGAGLECGMAVAG